MTFDEKKHDSSDTNSQPESFRNSSSIPELSLDSKTSDVVGSNPPRKRGRPRKDSVTAVTGTKTVRPRKKKEKPILVVPEVVEDNW